MTKHGATIRPMSSAPGIRPREVQICVLVKTCTQMFTAVLVLIARGVETAQMFINGLTEKLNEVYPYPHDGIFSHMKEWY